MHTLMDHVILIVCTALPCHAMNTETYILYKSRTMLHEWRHRICMQCSLSLWFGCLCSTQTTSPHTQPPLSKTWKAYKWVMYTHYTHTSYETTSSLWLCDAGADVFSKNICVLFLWNGVCWSWMRWNIFNDFVGFFGSKKERLTAFGEHRTEKGGEEAAQSAVERILRCCNVNVLGKNGSVHGKMALCPAHPTLLRGPIAHKHFEYIVWVCGVCCVIQKPKIKERVPHTKSKYTCSTSTL